MLAGSRLKTLNFTQGTRKYAMLRMRMEPKLRYELKTVEKIGYKYRNRCIPDTMVWEWQCSENGMRTAAFRTMVREPPRSGRKIGPGPI